MTLLTLAASHRKLECTAWAQGSRPSLGSSVMALPVECGCYEQALEGCLAVLRGSWLPQASSCKLEAIGLIAPFGGDVFSGPEACTPGALARLQKLAPVSPLHVPATVAAAHAILRTFSAPLVLVFETAYFAGLPRRESSYALAPDVNDLGAPRRFGYHGLLHQAAVRAWVRRRRNIGVQSVPRVISLCLEPRPELVGVLGLGPVFVTSGATPLEGLPGDTSAGQIDPAIVLALAQSGKLGPEGIHDLLTRHSGLTALAGHVTTLEQVMTSDDLGSAFARSVFEHRLLLAAGSAIAAMGGVDGIVMSGRYAEVAVPLGHGLAARLARVHGLRGQPPEVWCFTESRDRVAADAVFAVAVGQG